MKEKLQDKKETPRTISQNRALHLWFQLVAETLNEAGLDMRKVLKPQIDIPWTKQSVKEYLWRPIQKAMLLKDSTTELTTKDLDKVVEVLNRHLGQKLEIETPPFPSIQDIMDEIDYESMVGYESKKRKNS